jgi:hypothetical protein
MGFTIFSLYKTYICLVRFIRLQYVSIIRRQLRIALFIYTVIRIRVLSVVTSQNISLIILKLIMAIRIRLIFMTIYIIIRRIQI